jgi:hypothetical protein
MKEYLDKILAYAPRYFSDLLQLISKPKTFLAECEPDSQSLLARALTFWLITIVGLLLLQIPLTLDNASIGLLIGRTVIFWVVLNIMQTIAIRVAFALVGGRGQWRHYLAINLYALAVGEIITVIAVSVSKGIILVKEPKLYAGYDGFLTDMAMGGWIFDTAKLDVLVHSDMALALIAFYLLMLVAVVWFVAVWGAFRRIAAVPKWRSGLALVLAQLLLLLLAPVSVLAGKTFALRPF